MTAKRLLVGVALSGCGGPLNQVQVEPDFVTPCGMEFIMESPLRDGSAFTQESAAAYEARALSHLSRLSSYDLRFATDRACAALNGYQVRVLPRTTWELDGVVYAGLTNCHPNHLITINNDSLQTTNFIHEMAHAIQGCNSGLEVSKEDAVFPGAGHEGWGKAGFEAVFEAMKQELVLKGSDK